MKKLLLLAILGATPLFAQVSSDQLDKKQLETKYWQNQYTELYRGSVL